MYLIKDELALRFPKDTGNSVRFATASRLCTPKHGYTYILTTLNSEFKGNWPQGIRNVLILDDGIISGETIRSLVAEIIGDSLGVKTYPVKKVTKKKKTAKEKTLLECIHVTIFVNRLTDGQTKFFRNIEEFTGNLKKEGAAKSKDATPIVFSTLFSLPIRAYQEDACPVCKRLEYISGIVGNKENLSTIRNFYSEWHRSLQVLNHHENVSTKEDLGEIVCGDQAHKIASALIAINDGEVSVANRIITDLSFMLRGHIVSVWLNNWRNLRMGPNQRLNKMIDLITCAEEELKQEVETSISPSDVCVTLLRIIIGHIIDSAALPLSLTKDLGCNLIKAVGVYLDDDCVLWGLVTFVWACLKDASKESTIEVQKEWTNCLFQITKGNGSVQPNISFLAHFIRNPDSKFSSPGNAVHRLHRICSKIKRHHGHSREPIVQIRKKFNTIKTPQFDVNGRDIALLRHALSTFEEIIQCTNIIGVGGQVSAAELKRLINSQLEIEELRKLADPGNVERVDEIALVKKMQTHYKGLYDTWFPAPVNVSCEVVPGTIPRILKRFSVNLKECWDRAWRDFASRITLKVNAKDMFDFDVLCDSLLMVNTFSQYLENLIKHKHEDSNIDVSFEEYHCDGNHKGIRLINTGTYSANENRHGGLVHFRLKLEEYGAVLRWGRTDIGNNWQVTLVCEAVVGEGK